MTDHPDVRACVGEIVAGVLALPPEQVRPDAHFYDDLGGDSLQKLEVIAHIEARYRCTFADEEAASCDTVADLAERVAARAS